MFTDFLKSVFRFRKTNVSLLLILTYAILGLLFAYDRYSYKFVSPNSTDFEDAPGLLEDSWLDLQIITRSFHPYFTKDNDRVHDYLLQRISNITDSVQYARVHDDVQNKSSICLKASNVFDPLSEIDRAYYFESANILVKLEGKKPKLPGLLLSAHYDSVPTSHGATDDGKGIVTLMGVLNYFTKHQPERTIVFNFNDNEEFGLLGAEAFFAHPWSKIVSYVINLEGTGTGSKAVLFRTSDASTSKIYQQAVRKSPFGNSIYQQGFNDGLVSSQTDYVVYAKYGLRGFDIAFYKPRALYHTIKDSIQYTSREALWHMFHSTWQLVNYISFNEDIDEGDQSPAVFFDVLGLKYFSFSAKILFKWNCIILIVCPVLNALLELAGRNNNREVKSSWNIWLRLPVSFGLSFGIAYFTRLAMTMNNPFILSRDYILPLVALSTEFALVNYLILSLFEHISPTRDFKTIAFSIVTSIIWFILLDSTINMYKSGYKETGTYVFTLCYLLMSLGTTMGHVFTALERRPSVEIPARANNIGPSYSSHNIEDHQEQRDLENGSRVEDFTNDIDSIANNERELVERSSFDERAPLLQTNPQNDNESQKQVSIKGRVIKSLSYNWSIQFLVGFPLTSFIIFNSLDLILDAVHQTIQEGKAATIFAWNIVLFGAIALSLPLIPFTYKLNYILGLFFSAVFFISFILSLMEAPFTALEPLKIRFSQEIDLTNSTEAIVKLYGRKGGFIQSVLQDLPSVKESNATVWCEDSSNGLEMCSYVGLAPNLIDSSTMVDPHELLSVEVLADDRLSPDRSSYAPINARFKIKVKENRACSLWFKSKSLSTSPVRQVTIHKNPNNNKNSTESKEIKISTGINELHVFKLDFNELYYDIGVQWLPKIISAKHSSDTSVKEADGEDALGVSITCYWAEYDSESIVGGEHLRKIPAYDELLDYSPLNVSYSNSNKGLVLMHEQIQL